MYIYSYVVMIWSNEANAYTYFTYALYLVLVKDEKELILVHYFNLDLWDLHN